MNTLQKPALKLNENKNFQILEIGTFRPLSVNLISETVEDRGHPPKYYQMLPTQSIQQQKNRSKLDEK